MSTRTKKIFFHNLQFKNESFTFTTENKFFNKTKQTEYNFK